MNSTLASLTPKRSSAFSLPVFILFAAIAAGCFSYFYGRGIPWIHDEASYLFQAKTFLLGRFVNPVHPQHLFFDQYQVINEGIYASKYFPGFGLTLLPFVAAGHPYLNPVFFYGLQLWLLYLIGKEIFGDTAAKLGVALAAFSPQIFLQVPFLLNHVAGSVFCLLFFLGFIKWRKENSTAWIAAAGFGWIMAFLIRPVSAVGFGFPIALAILFHLKKENPQPVKHFIFWLIPALAGAALLLFYDKAVTGDWFLTPFDLYAKIHAPFHRYGFNTWVKYASEALGPRVDAIFNESYHNHTLNDGLLLAGIRLSVFMKYLAGSEVLGAIALTCWILRLRHSNFYNQLIFAIWLSLQIVHIPHWFPGILLFGSNYLYEASGLVILGITDALITAAGAVIFKRHTKEWLKGFVLVWILFSFASVQQLGENMQRSKFPVMWLYKSLKAEKISKAVVFVEYEDGHDGSHDFNYNVPTLDSPVVFAKDFGEQNTSLKPYFPGYVFFRWDFMGQKLEKLD